LEIRYDELIVVPSIEAKAKVHIPADPSVLLFRNGGNFDFVDRRRREVGLGTRFGE
jgi:hypothetical protein